MWNPLDCNIALAGAVALVASLAVGPAFASQATSAQETQIVLQTDSGEPLVCKTFALTGTRIQKEYCLTEDDWEDIRQDSRRVLERLMRVGTGT